MNPILALIIANIIWGAASPIFKFALQNIPPFTLAFVRFFFAALIFLPFAIQKWQRMSFKDIVEICLGAFFGVTINITFFFMALPKTASINAPVIGSAGPVFLYLLSILFLKEKPSRKVILGMLVALVGVLIIILSPIFMDGGHIVTGEIEGNLFLVIATIGAIFHPLLYKNVLKKINLSQVITVGFLFSALTFLVFVPHELQNWSLASLNIHGWVGIVFGVLFSSALAYYLYDFGVSRIDVQEVGLFNYIDPVVAVLLAIPLLAEYPNLYFFLGTILVFGGIYLAERRVNYHPFHKLKMSK